MIVRLISDDVERLGNVQWWSFGESVQFRPVGENMQCEAGHRNQRSRQIQLIWPQLPRKTPIHVTMNTRSHLSCSNILAILVPLLTPPGVRKIAASDLSWSHVDTAQHPLVTKRDLVKCGYTDECQACTQVASGMHNEKVPHDE